MANTRGAEAIPFPVASATEIDRGQFVKLDGTKATIIPCAVAGEDSIGVADQNSAAGSEAAIGVIVYNGLIGIVKCGGTVTKNHPVATDANGLAVNAAAGNVELGIALDAGKAVTGPPAENTIIRLLMIKKGGAHV